MNKKPLEDPIARAIFTTLGGASETARRMAEAVHLAAGGPGRSEHDGKINWQTRCFSLAMRLRETQERLDELERRSAKAARPCAA